MARRCATYGYIKLDLTLLKLGLLLKALLRLKKAFESINKAFKTVGKLRNSHLLCIYSVHIGDRWPDSQL